ncbi:hypothetical protein ONE63_007379 [Megalurothrips usitatus]|uniref:Uncharacterized protein n=1 Tax=Megalurothrips usitatus TaxID=439358 RepID=A0AAV7XQX4_9NEOP|nr:hypothetical protein ONE63_007379 [Megalurothrips usitatus]
MPAAGPPSDLHRGVSDRQPTAAGALNADGPKSVCVYSAVPSVFKAGPGLTPRSALRYKSARAAAGSPPAAAGSPPAAAAAASVSRDASSPPTTTTSSSASPPRHGLRMKLKERLVLGLSVTAVLFTLLLVMDLQMDLGMSGHHLVPSHGRVRYANNDNTGNAYSSFRRKFLQRNNNASREYNSGERSVSARRGAFAERGWHPRYLRRLNVRSNLLLPRSRPRLQCAAEAASSRTVAYRGGSVRCFAAV